jgi:hypothetical protein
MSFPDSLPRFSDLCASCNRNRPSSLFFFCGPHQGIDRGATSMEPMRRTTVVFVFDSKLA